MVSWNTVPKKPALAEAMALNYADNTDAKLETMREILKGAGHPRTGSVIIACLSQICVRAQSCRMGESMRKDDLITVTIERFKQ